MVSDRSQWSETHLFLLNLTHSEKFVKWLEKFDPGNGAVEILLPMTTANDVYFSVDVRYYFFLDFFKPQENLLFRAQVTLYLRKHLPKK